MPLYIHQPWSPLRYSCSLAHSPVSHSLPLLLLLYTVLFTDSFTPLSCYCVLCTLYYLPRLLVAVIASASAAASCLGPGLRIGHVTVPSPQPQLGTPAPLSRKRQSVAIHHKASSTSNFHSPTLYVHSTHTRCLCVASNTTSTVDATCIFRNGDSTTEPNNSKYDQE